MPKSSRDRILPGHSTSDSEDSSEPGLECETCCVSFPSVKALDAHLKGKKHARKVQQERHLSELLQEKDLQPSDDSKDEELHCDLCDKSFTGHQSYLAHLKGSGHTKNLKKAKLRDTMGDVPTGVVSVVDHDDSDDDVIPKVYARCSTCNKEFSGVEPLAAHLRSDVHRRKVGAAKIKVDSDDHLQEDEAFATCKVCSKSFSGPIPYRTHKLSNVHKKNLERAQVTQQLLKEGEQHDPEVGFVCRDCGKAFADPLAFRNHLSNNAHERTSAKKAMKEFLLSHPEIVFVAPFGGYDTPEAGEEEEGDDSGGESSRKEFYLICSLCQMSFSGPESAKDHVKSKKHLSLKERRRVQRLIKEQEKMSSGKKPNGHSPEVSGGGKDSGAANGRGSAERKSETPGRGADEDDFELI